MLTISLPTVDFVHDAVRAMLDWLHHNNHDEKKDMVIKITLINAKEEDFFAPAGCMRTYFRSRDRELEWWGLGIAEAFEQNNNTDESALSKIVQKRHSLDDEQVYFGGLRFDKQRTISSEWKDFSLEKFVLPLILVCRDGTSSRMILNYRQGFMPYRVWRDQAETILLALLHNTIKKQEIVWLREEEVPNRANYNQVLEHALLMFKNDKHKKVVIGRRNSRYFAQYCDPFQLFFELIKRTPRAFLFMMDNGANSAFFGASPELLYRRIGQNFETESLAGTRPRSTHQKSDENLKEQLLKSIKDKSEHALVSDHIEERLQEFGITDLFTSKLEIMSLEYVHHIHRRYHGRIEPIIGDDKIISALHPTPAVCGIESDWARDFIREHEQFDRGYFAAPVGYLGKNSAEFAVAIRCALYHDSALHIYAAGGIVPGSYADQEWEELNNKQKNILALFNGEHAE